MFFLCLGFLRVCVYYVGVYCLLHECLLCLFHVYLLCGCLLDFVVSVFVFDFLVFGFRCVFLLNFVVFGFCV